MRKKMLILSFLTLGMIGIFILVGLNGFDEYALKSRFLQIAAIIIVAICIAVFNSDFFKLYATTKF